MIDQGELFSIPNPCKGVCTSNSRGYCRGCLRSRQERFHWHEFSPFQQQLIANACEKRRLKILAARNGVMEEDFGEEPDQADLFVIQPLPQQSDSVAESGRLTESSSPEALPENHLAESRHAAASGHTSSKNDAPETSEQPGSQPAEKQSPSPQNPTPVSGDQFDLF